MSTTMPTYAVVLDAEWRSECRDQARKGRFYFSVFIRIRRRCEKKVLQNSNMAGCGRARFAEANRSIEVPSPARDQLQNLNHRFDSGRRLQENSCSASTSLFADSPRRALMPTFCRRDSGATRKHRPARDITRLNYRAQRPGRRSVQVGLHRSAILSTWRSESLVTRRRGDHGTTARFTTRSRNCGERRKIQPEPASHAAHPRMSEGNGRGLASTVPEL